MSIKYIFICAAARSGSTLLDMLLGLHPNIESLGEANFLGKSIARDEACSCGQPVRTCSAWQPVFERIRVDKGVDLLRSPYGLRQWDTRMDNANADFTQQTKVYLVARLLRKAQLYCHFFPALRTLVPLPGSLRVGIDNAFYFYDLIRELRKVDLVVDSSKEIHKAVSAYLHDPNSVRIIWLTRDGRGVMYSRLYSGVKATESPKQSINQWAGYNSRALFMLNRYVAPEHVHNVRYEELAKNTSQTMSNIFTWLGQSDVSADSGSIAVTHIAGGNDGTKARFSLGVKEDGRWRVGLGTDELTLFYRLAGKLNKQLGYD